MAYIVYLNPANSCLLSAWILRGLKEKESEKWEKTDEVKKQEESKAD